MKKILIAILTIVAINACNSPQKMTSPNGDSSSMNSSTDTSTKMQGDTTTRRN